MSDEKAAECGIWFGVLQPRPEKTEYGVDPKFIPPVWKVWDKDGDSAMKTVYFGSRQDIDNLIRLLQAVRGDLDDDPEALDTREEVIFPQR